MHYPALDGIRGIAIILVILYHNFNFVEYFNYGWLGVDLFFVLSGFLITSILLKTIHSKNYFRNFYAKRVLRIFPLYFLSLLVFIIILPAFHSFPLDMKYYQENQIWFWTYLQNWTLVFNQKGQGTTLIHFWSLAVEEQYYFIWPILVLWIRKPKRLLFFCIILLLSVIISRIMIWNYHESISAWERLFLFSRIDGIIIGSMLATIHFINPLFVRKYFTTLICSLVVINYLFYFLNRSYNYIFPSWAIAGFTTFASIFAFGIYEAIMKENKIINFFFTLPFFRFLGKYSYGFYIIHFPVFLLLKPYTDKFAAALFIPDSIYFLTTTSLLATMAGLLVSILSFHLFEIHFLKLKKHFE